MYLVLMLALLAVAAYAVLMWIQDLAKTKRFFTTVSQMTTRFVVAGESLLRILPNVDNFCLSTETDPDGQAWLIPEPSPENRTRDLFRNSQPWSVPLQTWLWKKYGVLFYSIWYPNIKVLSFDIRSIKTVKERNEVEANMPLRTRIVDAHPGQPTKVDDLRFLVPRPVYIEGVELPGDNSKVNLLVLPVFRQVIPTLPVFGLKGDFFTLLDAAIEAAIVDFFSSHRVAVYTDDDRKGTFAGDTFDESKPDTAPSPLMYALWLEVTKAGDNAPMQRHLRSLNVTPEYLDQLPQGGRLRAYAETLVPGYQPHAVPLGPLQGLIPSGIFPRFGFALVSFRLVDWEPHISTEPLAQALLSKQTEHHKAAGVREAAYGQRDAQIALAEGEKSQLEQEMGSLIAAGVSPDVAAQYAIERVRMDNVRRSNLNTLVEGGSRGASVMVPAAPPSPQNNNPTN